jgi:hypothetical protein
MRDVQLDRNGLRPARYLETDDLVCMMSETGVVPNIDESKIIKKGRLGPGQVDICSFVLRAEILPAVDVVTYAERGFGYTCSKSLQCPHRKKIMLVHQSLLSGCHDRIEHGINTMCTATFFSCVLAHIGNTCAYHGGKSFCNHTLQALFKRLVVFFSPWLSLSQTLLNPLVEGSFSCSIDHR